MMKVLVVLMLFGSVYMVQSQTVCLQELFAAFGDIKEMKLELKNLQEKNKGEQVAFAASLWTSGSGYFGPYSKDTPMVFKHVFTNIGNAYSPVTGRFTAPLRGAYHFECHIFGGGASKQIGARLMKNSERIFFAYQSNNQPVSDSASNSVTLLLKAGDVVYMLQYPNTKVYDNSWHYTTFSGHLLFSM